MGYLFGVVAKYKILKKETARLADTLNSVQKKAKTLEKENIYLKQKLSSLTASQTSPTSQSPTFFLSPSQSPSPTAASQSSPSMGPPGSLFPRRPMSQTQWSPYFSKLITSNRLSLRQNKPNSEIRASQSYASPPTAMNSYRATNVGTPVTPVTAKSSPSFSDTQSPLTPADLNYIRSGRTSNISPTVMNLNTLSLNSQQKTNKKIGAKYFQRTVT
ncbi:DNA-directed RNA polymerase II subunit RPB1 isoform X2 [Bacillus rossius redtenbacheri]